MTPQEFQTQISRLKVCYTEKYYNAEVLKLLWNEVRFHSVEWFSKTIDNMIMHSKNPPTIADFKEQISIDKEIKWQQMKNKNKQDSSEFWSSKFQSDDIKLVCGQIKKRIKGELSEEDWKSFQSLLPK